MCHLALGEPVIIPVKIYIHPDLKVLFSEAIKPWNEFRTFFVEAEKGCKAGIYSGPRTWVDMHNDILFWAKETEEYWAAHELGHLLHLGDHIFPWQTLDGYINPMYTDNSYRGVMDYGTHPNQWFSEDDRRMIDKFWPLENKIVMPQVGT